MQPARGPDGREFMTASQRQMLRDDQRAQTDLSLAALQQAGEDRRAMLREAGESARFAARNALDERRLAGEQTALDFQNRAAERIERLYQQYEAASSPEERAAIAEQLRVLTGGQQANRFTVVPGGQEIDPITQQLVTRPAMVFNNQTGQFVPQPRSLPPIAENPAVIAIMNDTSLSREERAKRIRALGYQ